MTRAVARPVSPPSLTAKSRFRYQRDGRDVGPFTLEALYDEIHALRVGLDTLVFEERTSTWFRVGDEPRLARQVTEAVRESERVRLLEETHQAAQHVRSSHSRRWWVANLGIGFVLAAAGGASWLLFGAQKGTESHLHDSLLRSLGLETVAVWTAPSEDKEFVLALAEPRLPAPAPAPKAARRSTRSSTGPSEEFERIDTNAEGTQTAGAMEVDFDFADEESAGEASPTRSLSSDEINRLTARLGNRLAPCLESESMRTPGFSGITVEFTLQPSGSASGVRVTQGGNVTTDLIRCVQSKVGSIQVEPFAGSGRVIKVPLRIRTE